MKKNLVTFFLLVFSIYVFSQPGSPPGPSNNCWPPPCIPIDGGLSIFTVISMFFGYKLYSKKT